MRKPVAAAMALMLSGCVTPGGTGPGNIIEQAQSTATALCGFLPAAETIASILARNSPELGTASAIARAICAAVTAPTPSLRTRAGAPPPPKVVIGVEIKGVFVR